MHPCHYMFMVPLYGCHSCKHLEESKKKPNYLIRMTLWFEITSFSCFFFSNFMRQECLDSRFVFDRPLPVSRLVSLIGSSILFIYAFIVAFMDVDFKGSWYLIVMLLIRNMIIYNIGKIVQTLSLVTFQ